MRDFGRVIALVEMKCGCDGVEIVENGEELCSGRLRVGVSRPEVAKVFKRGENQFKRYADGILTYCLWVHTNTLGTLDCSTWGSRALEGKRGGLHMHLVGPSRLPEPWV